MVFFGRSTRGGKAALFVDGSRVGTISFHGDTVGPVFPYKKALRGLGSGRHHLKLVVLRGRAYVDRFRL